MRYAWDIGAVLARLGIEATLRGREWWAFCPNKEHASRRPHWHIKDIPGTDRHGLHLCHPCGFGGTLAQLVMHVRGCTLDEAREWLRTGQAPADVPSGVALTVRARRGRFRLPDEVSCEPLGEWPSPYRRYVEGRGIPEAQAARWGLGYAVSGHLAGRVVIPYRAPVTGEPRSYNARAIGRAPRKYIQPRPLEHADRTAIFGEQHWPQGDRSRMAVVLTEGELNGLAVERHWPWEHLPPCFAAAGGSDDGRPLLALKVSSFGLAVILSDADEAGDKFAAAIGASLSRHVRRVRVRLPDGQDADATPDLAERIDGPVREDLPG